MPSLPSVPRLPFVPDPLRRIHVTRDLDAITTAGEEAPDGGSLRPGGADRIWDAALGMYRSGVHPAVQVCVWRGGEVVVDRAIGHARGNGPQDGPEAEKVAATPATPITVFSASKAMTAFVVHKLIERKLVRLEDRICEYIPGYERNRKDKITVGQVLGHRAGVPNLPREALDLDHVNDREFLVEKLCEAKPFAQPGARLAYHAISGGFLMAEVAERAAGKPIREILAEEFLEPLGFRWSNYGVAADDVDEVALNYATGPRALPPLSTVLVRALGMPLDELVESSNDPRFLTAVVPSANVVTTAHELARFLEIFRRGGELDGVRVMEPQTVRTALTEQSHLELDFSLVYPSRFSYGLMLGARVISLFGRDTQYAFGHLGYTNILGWADPQRALSAAILTTGKPTLYPEIHRFLGLAQRITSEAPKVDAAEMMV